MAVKILYGTETGNSEALAVQASEALKGAGIEADVLDMGNVSLNDLKGYDKALFITSTWGDGDAPGNALELLEELQSEKSKCLTDLNYAVFGIGESIYEHFCQAAIDFDEAVCDLGAKRIENLEKSEDDNEENLKKWIEKIIPKLKS